MLTSMTNTTRPKIEFVNRRPWRSTPRMSDEQMAKAVARLRLVNWLPTRARDMSANDNKK